MTKEDKIIITGEDKIVEIKGDDNTVKIKGDDNLVEIKGKGDTIKVDGDKNKINIVKEFKKTVNFLKRPKISNLIIILLFLILLIFSSNLRLQNLPLLKNAVTGENIPLALDPYYFLRIAETMIKGPLPTQDLMRYPSLQLPFLNELLPKVLVFMYKVGGIFDNNLTIQYVDILYPVIFFGLGLIVFFLLILSVTKSKLAALISSAFLAVIPPFLYRTTAGFADHDVLGMFGLFLSLLVCSISLSYLEKTDPKNNTKKLIGLSLLLGLSTAFTIASWGGVAVFLFMIIPFTFLLIWLVNTKKQDIDGTHKNIKNILIFYPTWFFSTVFFGLLFGFAINTTIRGFFFGTSGLIGPFLLLFIFIDYYLIKNKIKFLSSKLRKYRVGLSAIIALIIGLIIYSALGSNPFDLISRLIQTLIHPFGGGRIGLTVAENKQTYLVDFFGQVGKNIFWLFYLGAVCVGINLAKGIKQKKHQIIFFLLWVVFISGLLFSRISPSSIFNGEKFISNVFYLLSILVFGIYCIWLYLNKEVYIKHNLILIVAWLIPMIISMRGAIRLFFSTVPFICFMIGYLVFNIVIYIKRNKEETKRFFSIVLAILIVVVIVFSFNGFVSTVSIQAKNTGPSAGFQWQAAMSWVQENTEEGSSFVHWWDYGYWVQYLGKRPSITDGGHANGFWDHLIGRYILTTPKPETALSFMKAHNVSYLLIDPTDIGKYSAYSRIGSNTGGDDRFSWIPVLISDPKNTQETSNGTTILYQGGSQLDEDIVYTLNGQETFLPAEQAGVGGIVFEVPNSASSSIKQPSGIFVYNGNQVRLPLRYLYFNGKMIDFKEGIEATAYPIPRIYQTNGYQIDTFGALIYLSPRITRGLVGQLYILNDAFERYGGFELVHAEPDPVINSFNSQGANLNEFTYFNGLRGPIKIWGIEYPDNIIAREEFLRLSGEYAEFDNLEFTK